jgi:hypothetical protein
MKNGGEEDPMFFVQVRLNSVDLLTHMSQMRIWLDAHRIETAGFSYSERIDRAVARVAFKAEREAGKFAARFAGRVISS